MNREVQIGDFVIVSCQDQQATYRITNFSSTNDPRFGPIVIELDNQYQLVTINGQWTLYGFINCTVAFHAQAQPIIVESLVSQDSPLRSFPFLGLDVNMKILNDLDDQDLSKACQVDKYFNQICNNEAFWRRRIEKFFPEDLNKKGMFQTFRDFYKELRDLVNNNDRPTAIKKGFLGVLKTFNVKRTNLRLSDANWAARHGQLEILKWLATRGILPDLDGADFAVMNGHLEVLKWLEIRGILPN